jgi:acyl carrier protein
LTVSATDMTTKDHVRQFVVEELEFTGEPDELTDEFELLEEGVLDSLGIMALVEYLEAAFDIVIDEDDIVAERFETIASIAALADAKLAET